MYSVLHYCLYIQTAGSALVDVLTGVVSPAGRLPNTWPASLDHVRITLWPAIMKTNACTIIICLLDSTYHKLHNGQQNLPLFWRSATVSIWIWTVCMIFFFKFLFDIQLSWIWSDEFCRSYTTFNYSDLKVEPPTVKAGQNVTVSVTVTNTGSRTSDEVWFYKLKSITFTVCVSQCYRLFYRFKKSILNSASCMP